MVLGSLETQSTHLSRSLTDALLLDKSLLDELNEVICENGRRKVSVLEEIKNFKKGIYMLQWETKALDLKVRTLLDHLILKMKLRSTMLLNERKRSSFSELTRKLAV